MKLNNFSVLGASIFSALMQIIQTSGTMTISNVSNATKSHQSGELETAMNTVLIASCVSVVLLAISAALYIYALKFERRNKPEDEHIIDIPQ